MILPMTVWFVLIVAALLLFGAERGQRIPGISWFIITRYARPNREQRRAKPVHGTGVRAMLANLEKPTRSRR